MNRKKPLELNELIRHGKTRSCFVHPKDPEKCIKVISGNKFPTLDSRGKNANDREYDLWRTHIQNNHKLNPFFPKLYGFEETALGKGLVFELIRDCCGEISQSLPEYLKNADKPARKTLRRQMQEIRSKIIRTNVLIYDWTEQNFLVQKTHNAITLKVIDFQSRPNTARYLKRFKAARKAYRTLPSIRVG